MFANLILIPLLQLVPHFVVNLWIADDVDPNLAVQAATLAIKDINRTHVVKLSLAVGEAPVVRYVDPLPNFQDPITHLEVIEQVFQFPEGFNFYAVTPQHTLSGDPRVTGAAVLCGVALNYAISYGTIINEPLAQGATPYPLQISRAVITHELLHSLGAGHMEGANVMNPAPFALISSFQPRLKILKRSVRQMRGCLATIRN